MVFTAIFGSLFAAFQIVPSMGASQYGRDGNNHLKQEHYEEAKEAYQEGLSSYQSPEKNDQIYHALQNNLGLTLHRQQNFEDAGRAFGEALAHAPNESAATRAAFNAGNNAFINQQLEQALEHYQTALMADPDNEDAKFNFEFVSRQLQEQQNQEQQSGGDNQEEQNEQNENENQGEEKQSEQEEEQNEEQQNEEQKNSEQEQEESGQEQSEPQETPLTREQAERILEALENEEEELLREIQKVESRPRRVAKDW